MNALLHTITTGQTWTINYLFQALAPDYKPFEHFHLSKNKVRYYIVITLLHGLAPVFKSLLIGALSKSPYLTVIFDESLNDNIQTNQMDIQVRYWDVSNGKAITQYMDSKFIPQVNAYNKKACSVVYHKKS